MNLYNLYLRNKTERTQLLIDLKKKFHSSFFIKEILVLDHLLKYNFYG